MAKLPSCSRFLGLPDGYLEELPHISKTYRKLQKRFNRTESVLKKKIMDGIDNLAIEAFTKKTNCKLCCQFLVLTARNSCCSQCFIEWMNEYDGAAEHDGSLVVCKMCIRPVNTALPNDQLTFFCKLVGLGEKKRKDLRGHYGYPIYGNREIDMLQEDMESQSKSNITE